MNTSCPTPPLKENSLSLQTHPYIFHFISVSKAKSCYKARYDGCWFTFISNINDALEDGLYFYYLISPNHFAASHFQNWPFLGGVTSYLSLWKDEPVICPSKDWEELWLKWEDNIGKGQVGIQSIHQINALDCYLRHPLEDNRGWFNGVYFSSQPVSMIMEIPQCIWNNRIRQFQFCLLYRESSWQYRS